MSFFRKQSAESGSLLGEQAAGDGERGELVTVRRTEGYIVKGKDAKEVNDLPEHYEWMVGRARMRVSDADADDVANAALYDAHYPSKERPPVAEVPRVKLWLDELISLRVRAHRKIVKKREAEVLTDKVHSLAPCSSHTDVEMQYADREWLRLALDSLPQDHRDLIVQCYIEELPIDKVALSLKLEPNTLHTKLRKIRAALRVTLRKLLQNSRRALRALFPFLFLRSCWKRMTIRARDVYARGIRHSVKGAFVAPGQLALGAIATVFVLGFAPSDPHATASERIEVASSLTDRRDVVLQSFERDEVASGIESTPSTRAEAIGPISIAVAPPARQSLTLKHSVIEEKGNQLGMLLEAKAALNKGNYEKALALVAEHEAKYPNSQHASKRETLRAIATKAMAAVRR